MLWNFSKGMDRMGLELHTSHHHTLFWLGDPIWDFSSNMMCIADCGSDLALLCRKEPSICFCQPEVFGLIDSGVIQSNAWAGVVQPIFALCSGDHTKQRQIYHTWDSEFCQPARLKQRSARSAAWSNFWVMQCNIEYPGYANYDNYLNCIVFKTTGRSPAKLRYEEASCKQDKWKPFVKTVPSDAGTFTLL